MPNIIIYNSDYESFNKLKTRTHMSISWYIGDLGAYLGSKAPNSSNFASLGSKLPQNSKITTTVPSPLWWLKYMVQEEEGFASYFG